MKCHKCGFTSFDYLSECKKCGVDLTSVRDGLGLWGVNPTVPFFLGLLLRDPGGSIGEPRSEGLVSGVSAEALPGIEFGDEFDLEEELVLAHELIEDSTQPAGQSAAADRQRPKSTSVQRTDDVIELSDEELTQFIDEAGAGKEPEFELNLRLDAEAPTAGEGLVSGATERTRVMRPASEDLRKKEEVADSFALDLADADLVGIVADLGGESDTAGLRPQASVRASAPVETLSKPAEARRSTGSTEDNLVLELSEDDLENILMGLEDTRVDEDDTIGDNRKMPADLELK